MRCTNCTTELWGQPSVCPVCGAPTSPQRAPRAQAPGTVRPSRPQPAPPPAPASFFNAADLLDPEILDEVGLASASPRQNTTNRTQPAQRGKAETAPPPAGAGGFLNAADLFDPDIFDRPEPAAAPEPPAGKINAADLFDPEVLEGLSGEEEEAPGEPLPGGPARFNASQLLDEDVFGDQFAQGWEEPAPPEEDDWLNSPPAGQRAPTAPPQPPVAAPLFNLPPLAPEAPPRRTSRSGALRPASQPPVYAPEPYAPEPVETELDPGLGRGWRIVSPAPPPATFPVGPRPGMRRQPPPPPPSITARLISALGKTTILLLVLGIIGAASLIGYARCQQLNCWQSLLSGQSTALPTVTPMPGFASYQDAQLSITIEYPKDWQRASGHRANDGQYQGERFSISIYAWMEIGTSPQYSGWTPEQINTAAINSIRALPNVIGTQTWTPETPTTHLDGQDWTIEDAAFTLQDGTTLQLTTLALVYKGHGYVIFYQSHQEEFTLFSSHYFEPMLLSFRFLND